MMCALLIHIHHQTFMKSKNTRNFWCECEVVKKFKWKKIFTCDNKSWVNNNPQNNLQLLAVDSWEKSQTNTLELHDVLNTVWYRWISYTSANIKSNEMEPKNANWNFNAWI